MTCQFVMKNCLSFFFENIHCTLLIAAVSGAGLLYVIIPEESSVHLRGKIQSVSPWAGFGVELLLTVAVMLTVLMCTEKGHTIVDRAASVVFGQVVAACHLFAVIETLHCGNNQWSEFKQTFAI